MKINKLTCGAVKMFAGLALLGLASVPAFAATTYTSTVWTNNSNVGALPGPVTVTASVTAPFPTTINAGWSSDAGTDGGGNINYTSDSAYTLGTSGSTAQTVTFGGGSVVNPVLLFNFMNPTASIILNNTATVLSSNNCSLAGGVTITCTTRGMTDGIAVQLTGTFTTITFTYTDTTGSVNNVQTNGFSVAYNPAPQTAPTFTKAFSPSTIDQLQTSTLTFTITNPNSVPVTGLTFTDSLPAGMIFTFGVSNSCGFTLTGTNTSLSATNGSVGAGPSTSCTLVETVQATGAGSLVNTTSTLTSNAPTAAAATATLVVLPIADFPFQVRYSANLNIGESYIDITNDGANGDPLLGPGFGAASGNICVNVYAFDPNEELVSCCSCLVTPDQTVNLGVNADLTSKTLTGVVPTSVTIKLVATLAGTGGSGTGTICNNSAASIAGTGSAVTGMLAFGTTLHATPPTGTYSTTETPFTPATLSATELSSIVGRCAAIIGNASGFGICTSCRNGALGASKL